MELLGEDEMIRKEDENKDDAPRIRRKQLEQIMHRKHGPSCAGKSAWTITRPKRQNASGGSSALHTLYIGDIDGGR